MSENSQLSATILNKLEVFANAAWHIPSAFQRNHHRDDASRDVEYLHLQDHSTALHYLFGNAIGRRNKILVRSEYREAFQAFQTDPTYERGAHIIGQPGIGKTTFLIYALIERLREHKPVAVQLRANDPFYAFFTHTCSLYDLSDPLPLMQEGVWVLSDLRAATNPPLDIFRDVSAMVIQTTLPSIKYWERCTQCGNARAFVMNIWSEDETADLSSLMNLDVERMTTLAAKWGGIPRMLLQQYASDELQQDWEIRRAVAFAVKNYTALHAVDIQDVGTTSVVFFVVPLEDRSGKICRSRYGIRVPTPTLCNALMVALQQLQHQARIDFFLTMFDHPATRPCARNIYAGWFHSLVTPGKQLIRTRGATGSNLGEPLCTMGDHPFPIIRDMAVPTNRQHPCYWIPPSGEFPGIDCVILAVSKICVVQFATHFQLASPQSGLDKLQQLLPAVWLREPVSWRFLFVGISLDLASVVSQRWQHELTNKNVLYTVVDPADIRLSDTPVVFAQDDALDKE